MSLFVSILEGESADSAEPVLAIRDPAIIAAVGKLVLERLAYPGAGDAGRRVVRTLPCNGRVTLLGPADGDAE
jgi:hypothetical protein